MKSIYETFRDRVESSPDPFHIGQVIVLRDAYSGEHFEIRHRDDFGEAPETLQLIADWTAWRALIREDVAGDFRPLKAAPNLRAGWRKPALSVGDLLLALQYLYPAALANWLLWCEDQLTSTPYAESASRQTGRYHIVHTLGTDALLELTETVCARECLKRRLWEPQPDRVTPTPSEIPLLCPEACNYFIGKAREKIKGVAEAE